MTNLNNDIDALEALASQLAEKSEQDIALDDVTEEVISNGDVSEESEAKTEDQIEVETEVKAEDDDEAVNEADGSADGDEPDDAEAAVDSEDAGDDEPESAEKAEAVETEIKKEDAISAEDLLAQMVVVEEKAEDVVEVSSDEFLCGFQRKSVAQACEFCQGGCSSVDGLPGLKDIEDMVLAKNEGSHVLSSGYSNADDIFVVDIKTEDGDAREVFLSGDGTELGWFAIDEAVAVKSGEVVDIISGDEASIVAVKAIEGGGQVMGVAAGFFEEDDVYVVEIDGPDGKSYDVFVSTAGVALAYDEFAATDESFTDEELSEIKVDEAELMLKRMYSRERREELAESGEAMPDGSFPIVDEDDLENAILAHGRASDVEAAKRHIIKRAEALGLTEMIPEEWVAAPEADEEKAVDVEEAPVDVDAEEAPVDVVQEVLDDAPAELDGDVEPVAAVPVEDAVDEPEPEEKSFADSLAEFAALTDDLDLA
jgi:hypothetical protein